MKLIFFGTPSYAALVLENILQTPHQVKAVVTQPDKPAGRGLKKSACPVKELAIKKGLPHFEPEKLKDPGFQSLLQNLHSDLLVVVAYGRILPKELLGIARHGAINLHTSLLPKYRGAAPIEWAIFHGEKELGVTIMKIAETLDTGDILLQDSIKLGENEPVEEASDKLFKLGIKLMLKALDEIEKGQAVFTPQDEKKASYAPLIRKEMGIIDWKKSALEIKNQIRAFLRWPGSFTYYKQKPLKVLKVKILKNNGEIAGQVLELKKGEGFVVACGQESLLIEEVQPENRSKMRAADFILGYNIRPGMVFPN